MTIAFVSFMLVFLLFLLCLSFPGAGFGPIGFMISPPPPSLPARLVWPFLRCAFRRAFPAPLFDIDIIEEDTRKIEPDPD